MSMEKGEIKGFKMMHHYGRILSFLQPPWGSRLSTTSVLKAQPINCINIQSAEVAPCNIILCPRKYFYGEQNLACLHSFKQLQPGEKRPEWWRLTAYLQGRHYWKVTSSNIKWKLVPHHSKILAPLLWQ